MFTCSKVTEKIPVQLKEVCSYTDAGSCDADKGCSWCKSAAVKAACRTMAQAKSLPSAVFTCDKVQEKIPVQLKEVCSYADENTCNADSGCSWCTSAAVKAACRTMDQAKSLPAAVFTCAKVAEKIPVQLKEVCSYADAGSCNAAKCSWCISAAVKPACRDPQMAAKLPSSIF